MSARPEVAALAGRLRQGDVRALSRGISWVEDQPVLAQELLDLIYEADDGATPKVGLSQRVGLTGPPGVGKSTLTAALIRAYRDGGKRVGVVAVDPTSPFTGGALLGDRVRMAALAEDPEVFIRSMASRGRRGGLSAATADAVDLLEAAGKEVVLIETVGAGQTDLDVGTTAQTTVLVLSPESGDAIQAMKAGIMEVADVFVVNKSDRPDAQAMMDELRAALGPPPGDPARSWQPRVLSTVAVRGEGVKELVATLAEHRAHLESGGCLCAKREAQLAVRIREHLVRGLAEHFLSRRGDDLRAAAQRAAEGRISPWRAARVLLNGIIHAEVKS